MRYHSGFLLDTELNMWLEMGAVSLNQIKIKSRIDAGIM